MIEKINEIEKESIEKIQSTASLKELNDVNSQVLGKQGKLTEILRGMKDIPAEQRKFVGEAVNKARTNIENAFATAKENFENKILEEKLNNEKVDISEPASKTETIGALHPITRVFNKLIDCAVSMGFDVVTGPEIENDYYCFEALNVPKDHPARDMQDSFYLPYGLLLRTQTSSVQIRYMEKHKPPLKIISPGKTYRVDSDVTHSPMFHQIEGLVVDENITMVDLKLILTELLQMLFGKDTVIRFRPSYFPFTEPSVEVDATCPLCGGKGCKVCKNTGWLEMLGAGIVNPKVLENCGIDSKKYSGFAFGSGVDRLAMVINKVPDLRMMFENDVRFLKQMK